MRRTTTALLAAVAAAAPTAASAATVTREGGTLVYSAAAGMTNNVHVMAAEDGSTITFYTSGGDLMQAIPDGCVQSEIWPGEVVDCTPPSAVRVELGDGDDRGVVSDALTVPIVVDGGPGRDDLGGNLRANTLDGGAGDDTINGGPGDDVLRGGDGADDLQGKAGRDRLDGGAGNDLLHPDGHEDPSADVVDGGPGIDAIDGDYSSRFTDDDPPVAFTLAGGADDGRAGEGDDVRNVERIELNIAGTYTGTEGADEFRIAQITGSVGAASGGPAAPGRVKLALPKKARLASALRGGLAVRVTGLSAGKVTLVARRGRSIVARGTGTARGGAATVRLRFTAAARRQLRRARSATLAITGAGATLKVTLRR